MADKTVTKLTEMREIKSKITKPRIGQLLYSGYSWLLKHVILRYQLLAAYEVNDD